MNKGFTLMELLGVIVLLGILTTVVTIYVGNILDNSRSNLSNVQKKEIEEAAETYYIKEGINLSNFELDSYEDCVNVIDLINKGYINESTIIDPDDNEEMLGSVKIVYNSNQYTYSYQEISCE